MVKVGASRSNLVSWAASIGKQRRCLSASRFSRSRAAPVPQAAAAATGLLVALGAAIFAAGMQLLPRRLRRAGAMARLRSRFSGHLSYPLRPRPRRAKGAASISLCRASPLIVDLSPQSTRSLDLLRPLASFCSLFGGPSWTFGVFWLIKSAICVIFL